MVQPVWIDYGYWKNWYSPWGEIAIEQCSPTVSDRGRVVIKTLTHGAVNLLFNPLLSNAYFFSELRAEQHLIGVTTLAQRLTEDEQPSFKVNELGVPRIFPGKNCFCELNTLLLRPVLVPVIIFNVKVNAGEEKGLHIDECDMFPRYYLDHSIALAEVNAWMQERGQLG